MWRVSATPSDLESLARGFGASADRFRSAAARCAGSSRLAVGGTHRLGDLASDVERNVRRVSQDLDAADLARRLSQWSTTLHVSMRSRSLRFPSNAARSLAQGSDRQFLRVDAEDHGAVVEIFGDLSRAAHIAVIVPGMTNSLADYDPTTRIKGQDLAAAMGELDPNVAVVAWLGYRTPDFSISGLLEGAGSDRARVGARDLLSDLELIRRMAPQAHLSLVGHSYGSVVVGETLLSEKMRTRVDRLAIEDVAVVGSPGMNTSSRRALGHLDTSVWAARVTGTTARVRIDRSALWMLPVPGVLPFRVGPIGLGPLVVTPPFPRDVVPFAPFHGEDPSAKGFGAKGFSVAGAVNHSTYFVPGTLSLENLARIATNTPVETKKRSDPDKKASAHARK